MKKTILSAIAAIIALGMGAEVPRPISTAPTAVSNASKAMSCAAMSTPQA